jgi:GMP synthase (glutamine-hydrolysing)
VPWHDSCVVAKSCNSDRFTLNQRILIVLHQEHSTPGRVGRLLRQRGYELEMRRPPCGCSLPEDLDEYAGAVVFGGPMSANDEHEWLRRQTDWIGCVLSSGIPFLGLCLGAQMLARQLGACVKRHPEGQVEVGYYPVSPTEAGERFAGQIGAAWPDHVYHWHSEGFDLPRGAEALASGKVFPHQAYRYGDRAFGLQFHPEVTYAMMCRWTVRGHENLDKPGALPRERQLADWYLHDPKMRLWIDAFLDAWLATGKARPAEALPSRAA